MDGILGAMDRLTLAGHFSYEVDNDGRVLNAWFGRGNEGDPDVVNLLDLAKALHTSGSRYRITIERDT
jgi:hypothetical protein